MYGDDLIRQYGKLLTINRTPSVTAYVYLKPGSGDNPQRRYNFTEALAQSGKTIVAGEVLQDGTTYYLVANAEVLAEGSTERARKLLLLTCNGSVTVKKPNAAGSGWTTVASNVRCLITKARLDIPNDEVAYGERNRSNQPIIYVYMAASVGLTASCIIVDGTRNLKILDDVMPYLAGGIVEAQAVLDT